MSSPSLKADLVIQFVASTNSASKQDARNKAQTALTEYNALLETFQNASLLAAGKLGNSKGEILVLVFCPWEKLRELIEQERHVAGWNER
jgi:hypothetical protein